MAEIVIVDIYPVVSGVTVHDHPSGARYGRYHR
jgi:hypothetical protein